MGIRSVFISYSSTDVPTARSIEETLRASGVDTWRDQTRIENDWPREIALALSNADALILLWSGSAAASKWVRHEWLTARALEKPIIVCLPPDAPELV